MAVSSVMSDVLGVLGGCMGCMVVVENIAKQQPSSMNLMTLSTFLFIAAVGLIHTSKFFTVPNKIPLRGYAKTVTVFFIVNVINNQALNFHVPVPLHIIFRSGSLLANMLLNVILMGRSYSLRKYISVFAITLGIIICTLATSQQGKDSGMSMDEASKHYVEWSIGIAMLSFALLASALLGIYQQQMYEQYGKHPDEAMFVTHALALPAFSLMYKDIARSAAVFTAAAPASFLGLELPLSGLWLNMLASCVLQWVCIRFVYRLNASVDSLTVTLVVTLRKFLSLLVSIVYFQNPFSAMHWLGTFFVFAGTLAFDDVFFKSSIKAKKQE